MILRVISPPTPPQYPPETRSGHSKLTGKGFGTISIEISLRWLLHIPRKLFRELECWGVVKSTKDSSQRERNPATLPPKKEPSPVAEQRSPAGECNHVQYKAEARGRRVPPRSTAFANE